jgi:hypothetical protein
MSNVRAILNMAIAAFERDAAEGRPVRQEMANELRLLFDETDKEYALYGYVTPSGKLYASGMLAVANGEQSWVKVYVNKEDLK